MFIIRRLTWSSSSGRLLKWVLSHIRRVILIFVNLIFNHDWCFALIGSINKKLNIIESVFLAYPANDEYALAYVYRYRLPKVRWSPFPVGLLWQNGRATLMFTISTNNDDFINDNNIDKIKDLEARMESIRILVGANMKSFAGILPGIMFMKRIVKSAPEADITASVVYQSIETVIGKEGLRPDDPIIILGGRGFIGRRVVKKLRGRQNVFSVDLGSENKWPDNINGRRMLIVNIANREALRQYFDQLRPGMVLLNEVYPEPTSTDVEELKELGCKCYHIAGVKSLAFPPFPAAYKGAIPCCAAWPSEDIEASILKMT